MLRIHDRHCRRRRGHPSVWIGALVLLVLAGPVAAKSDPAAICRAKIVDGAAKLLRQVENATQKCRDGVLTGKLPGGTVCPMEPKTAAAIEAYENAFARTVARNCGGDDNACNTGDDIPLADIGWNIGVCPNVSGADCASPIVGCFDVGTCLTCLVRGSVDRVVGLTYDSLATTPPADKAIRKCQATIGKAAAKLVAAQSTSLAGCWRSVLKGKATAPCPEPGDGKAAAVIAGAVGKLESAICKACGGADKQCGGGDDVALGAIGFPGTCPAFGGCTGPVTSVAELARCVACISGAGVDCPDRAAVPGVATYPPSCPAPVPTATPRPTLDYSLPPNYGSTSLTSGFVPDPYSVGVTSGGSVDVSYLGGNCVGFATSAPDFSVNYTSGAFPTLRFYFVGSGGGDTTMIVNSPSGTYHCGDDSFGTLDPTIDFTSPSSGRYDIWIASYTSGSFVSGVVYVTEGTGNHP